MNWIDVIDEADAENDLKIIYNDVQKKRRKISNIMKIHSLNTEVMKNHMNLYLSIMFGKSDLKREEREMIAVVVSIINKCDYCIKHHKEALQFYWNKEKVRDLIKDYKSLVLSNRLKMIINYVEKLTINPYEINKKDIDILKEIGLSDRNILDINLIASYFNFVNRIALGLGVKFSNDEIRGYKF